MQAPHRHKRSLHPATFEFKRPPGGNSGLGIHYPDEGDGAYTGMELQILDIKHFGPVGIEINLVLPPFQMQLSRIDKGSPAEAAGKLKVGQMIESINGQGRSAAGRAFNR